MTILVPLDAWPDTRVVAVQWLKQSLPDATVLTKTGTNLAQLAAASAGVVQVLRVPGGSNDAIEELSTIDVYSFAISEDAAVLLARRVNAAMLNLAGARTGAGAVDWVTCTSSVGVVPYSNPLIERAIATYEVTTRVQSVI